MRMSCVIALLLFCVDCLLAYYSLSLINEENIVSCLLPLAFALHTACVSIHELSYEYAVDFIAMQFML